MHQGVVYIKKIAFCNSYLADSSLKSFMGCISSSANNSPPGQKSVMRQTCVGVWKKQWLVMHIC